MFQIIQTQFLLQMTETTNTTKIHDSRVYNVTSDEVSILMMRVR